MPKIVRNPREFTTILSASRRGNLRLSVLILYTIFPSIHNRSMPMTKETFRILHFDNIFVKTSYKIEYRTWISWLSALLYDILQHTVKCCEWRFVYAYINGKRHVFVPPLLMMSSKCDVKHNERYSKITLCRRHVGDQRSLLCSATRY